jgi:YNFM family putative membrane transporter
MFAAMYSTQTILPELARDFAVTPSQTGLTISVVVVAVAVAGWVWGPLSDRIGRKRSLTLASGLLALPTLGVALAPSFGLLLFFRAVQGLCMPGLIIVGVPYVAEVSRPGWAVARRATTRRRSWREAIVGRVAWGCSRPRRAGAGRSARSWCCR